MLKLTGFEQKGDLNITIHGVTTNEQMSKAILNAFTERLQPNVVKRTREVKDYVKRLENVPDGLWFDPCYEVGEEKMVVGFKFVKE